MPTRVATTLLVLGGLKVSDIPTTAQLENAVATTLLVLGGLKVLQGYQPRHIFQVATTLLILGGLKDTIV